VREYSLKRKEHGLMFDAARKLLLRTNTVIRKSREIIFPKHVPAHLIDAYTLNKRIRIKNYSYRNDGPADELIVYTQKEVDDYIDKIRAKRVFYYGETDAWLYQALEKYGIDGKDVAVIGSIRPLYESVCLFYGGRPTTIEYNKRICEDGRLRILTVAEYNENPVQFDAAFSISSFEHDGLGRYGDPLNPAGDFEAMRKAKTIVREGGLLFLAVPVGRDTLVWDAHRVYGRIRLPLLLEGWRVLDTFGFSEELFDTDRDPRDCVQPVFVLENLDPKHLRKE
jgi:uncharacterized protein DUF268